MRANLYSAEQVIVDNNVLQAEMHRLSAQLLWRLEKILKPYDKNLRTYLRCVEYPESYLDDFSKGKKLFSSQEISQFLGTRSLSNGLLPPLEKVVILAAQMNRSLVLSFDGLRSAQIPVAYSDQPDDYIKQLWLNVYGVLSALDAGLEKRAGGVFPSMERDLTDGNVTDCGSLEAVILAAAYRGFQLNLSIRRQS